VRARSFELFVLPSKVEDANTITVPPLLFPVAVHSFGWVEHITVVPRLNPVQNHHLPNMDILIRTRSRDLWHPSPESVELWELEPLLLDTGLLDDPLDDESYVPYHFPPRRRLALPSLYVGHSSPRCRTLMLGPRGTVHYICANAQASLIPSSFIDAIAAADIDTQSPVPLWNLRTEALATVVLPTSSMRLDPEEDTIPSNISVLPMITNDTKTSWSCADYDEESGTIALGSGDGQLTMLRLGLSQPPIVDSSPASTNSPRASSVLPPIDPYSWASSGRKE
jgi:hypothetical protein